MVKFRDVGNIVKKKKHSRNISAKFQFFSL